MEKTINAVGYARYSTDKQTDNSIAYQLHAINEYCKKNGINIIDCYTDEGQTGTNDDRVGFQLMLADARQKKFDAVVIYDISRGSRDVGDWFKFRKEMDRLKINVISATQNLGDILNPNDFLTELLSVGLGQHAVLDIRKKSIDGVAEKAKKGAFLGGIAPLGYDIINQEYVINEVEANTVRTIFSFYAEGRSYGYIIDELKGARGKRGQLLGKNSNPIQVEYEEGEVAYCERSRVHRLSRQQQDHIRKVPELVQDQHRDAVLLLPRVLVQPVSAKAL